MQERDLMQERDFTNGALSKFRDAFSGPNSEKLAIGGLTLLIAYAAIRSVVAAAAKPLWYDEICTRIVALQPNVRAIADALNRGADGQAFSFYLIERVAASLVPYERIAFRAPSILAFCCTVLCLFFLVRRRSGGICALLCAAVPFVTVLFITYAVEARAYSLLVTFIALALLCYQRAPKPRWLILMAICLAAAEAMHYYAIFAFVPFAIAEAFVLLAARRIRIGVWLALLCGFIPLALSWKMLQALKQLYGAHFWSPPTVAAAIQMYSSLFRFNGVLGFAVAVALMAGILSMVGWEEIGQARIQAGSISNIQDCAAAFAFLALPIIEFVAVKIMHGGFVARYTIPTLLGASLGLGLLLPRLGVRVQFLVAVFLACALFVQEGAFWAGSARLSEESPPIEDAIAALGTAARSSDLTVVISDGVEYLDLAYNAPAALSKRTAFLVDPVAAIKYSGTNMADVNLPVLQTIYPLQVYDFTAFATEHRRFLLVSDGGRFDWWPTRLDDDGYSVQLLSIDHGHKIYLVDLEHVSR